MLTLTNDFHNTSYRTRKTAHEVANMLERLESGWPTYNDQDTARRFRKALCGVKDCNCGDFIGCRPAFRIQNPEVE